MAVVTGDRYLEKLVRFVDGNAGPLIDGTLVLKLNPTGLHYVQSRLEALGELEGLLAGAPVDYLRAYVSDLGDHRALEQLRRILRLLTSLKVVSVLAPPARDPTPVSLAAFGRLRDLELRGCDLSSSAAKGLLELRHTLERIVCHNSTDALRHVFASRLAEVKESPQWKRLSFVSCAGNGLLLMDESLQLLPAVETLDLSRNKLTKVDNLRHCLNLKHLDLGFNNLRSVSSFNQVSCNIVKLVLRNNALSTLHGIENLKSLEDLDVSYNIISNFSQLEFLVGLPYLGTLWLEGNPLCCARWYRPQAFSYINHPYKFKLDNKEISTREFWKRQIIIARRQKRPASFGFYSPAVYDSKSEGSNRRRKKMTRLALIGGEGESTTLYSDQDSTSIDNEVQSREDTVLSDEDAEIADLMNKVEQMKKDGSVLWLREFKEWMDHPDENVVDHTTFIGQESLPTKTGENHTNEILRCAPHSLKASREESSTNGVESDRPYLDKLTELEYLDGIGVMGTSGEFLPIRMDPRDECLKSYTHEIRSTLKSAHATVSPLTTIDSISESHSSAPPGSPPQYRKDILKRRQCLEEDFVQFSEDSYSVASSDSYTSSSEDDACAFGPMSHADQSLNDNFSNTNKYLEREPLLDMFKDEYYNQGHRSQENGQCSATDCFSNKTDIQNKVDPYQLCSDEDPEIHCGDAESDLLHEKRGKPQTKRSVTRVQDGSNMVGIIETAEGFNSDVRGEECQFCDVDGNKYTLPSMGCTQPKDDFIRNHFNSDVADLRNREICHQFMRCDCVLEQDSLGRERDVALVLSSLRKLYILLIGSADDKSGTALRLLACHRVEDIKDVLVGVGLQLVRVSIEKGLTYLFLTRSVEKSINLFCLLNVFGSSGTDSKCSVKSLEQVQLNLFEKQIFGGSKVCIFQYALVLFQNNNHEADSWVPRSLFVAGVNLLLCAEDLRKFGSLLVDSSMPSYFTLDSYCSIADISEMVVEAKDNNCVTLALAHAHHLSGKSGKASDFRTWKLKCLSKDCVFKFVTLVKAIHVGMNTSSLNIRCIS